MFKKSSSSGFRAKLKCNPHYSIWIIRKSEISPVAVAVLFFCAMATTSAQRSVAVRPRARSGRAFVRARSSMGRRRVVVLAPFTLPFAGWGSARAESFDWASPGLASRPEDDVGPEFIKTANGTKVQILQQGRGEKPSVGDTIVYDFVLRRSNGYFVYSTVEGLGFQPRDVPTGPREYAVGSDDERVISGLREVLMECKAGSQVRLLVQPENGYTPLQAMASDEREPSMPTYATRRQLANHASEPLLFEVQVSKIRRKQ